MSDEKVEPEVSDAVPADEAPAEEVDEATTEGVDPDAVEGVPAEEGGVFEPRGTSRVNEPSA